MGTQVRGERAGGRSEVGEGTGSRQTPAALKNAVHSYSRREIQAARLPGLQQTQTRLPVWRPCSPALQPADAVLGFPRPGCLWAESSEA